MSLQKYFTHPGFSADSSEQPYKEILTRKSCRDIITIYYFSVHNIGSSYPHCICINPAAIEKLWLS